MMQTRKKLSLNGTLGTTVGVGTHGPGTGLTLLKKWKILSRRHHSIFVRLLDHPLIPSSSKMQSKFVAALVAMVIVILSCYSTAQEDLMTTERQVVAELAAQILRVAHGPWSAAEAHKRNSGMINSILGIPRVMAEAGKK
ncbi:pigment-dispersing hormone type 1-like [Macrobrachium rosenbergii]|uniref:pigment-dispersing hormone type 1-like n=1 Tax=Macrobrachium rosenbergii TaxID=79674 RepID=UPI0034D6E525